MCEHWDAVRHSGQVRVRALRRKYGTPEGCDLYAPDVTLSL